MHYQGLIFQQTLQINETDRQQANCHDSVSITIHCFLLECKDSVAVCYHVFPPLRVPHKAISIPKVWAIAALASKARSASAALVA